MKVPRLEAMRRTQAEHHRSHPWQLSQGGLFIPHNYEEKTADSLTGWDDVGFILNGRRVIVWFQHPRYVYGEAVWDKVWEIVGDGPQDDLLIEGGTKNYRCVGRSRKKHVSTTLRQPSPAERAHHDLLYATYIGMRDEGIDCSITANWKTKRLWWAMGVSLVAPLEVRNERDLAEVAQLAKRLLKRETTLEAEFPGYQYVRSNWLNEQEPQLVPWGSKSPG